MNEDLEFINTVIGEIEKRGLTSEIILSSLMALKDDPTITCKEAFLIACFEWDI